MFAAWGRFVYRFRWLVLAASILSIAAVVYSMGYGGRLGTGEFSAPEGTESGRVQELLDEEVAKAPPSFMLVFGSEDEWATDPAFRDQVERALEPLREDERVAGVRTAYEDGTTDEAMISRNGHATMRLMGDWNWWAPKPLARLHKRLGLSEKTIDAPDSAALPPYETTPSTKRR